MKISKKQLLAFQRAAQRQAFIDAGGCDGRFRKRVVGSKKRYDRSSEKRRWKKEWQDMFELFVIGALVYLIWFKDKKQIVLTVIKALWWVCLVCWLVDRYFQKKQYCENII